MGNTNDIQAKRQKHKSSGIIINALLIVVLVLCLIYVIYRFLILDNQIYTNDAQVEEYINPVNVRVSGYIKEVLFNEHQHVKKGDTLVIIDDKEYRIQLLQAEAAYMTALASKHVTASSVSTVRNNILVADENIRAIEAKLWSVEQDYKRYENLLKEGAATQQQFDQIKAEYLNLNAQIGALKKQRQTVNLTTDETSKRITVNDAEVKRAEAAVEMVKLNLSYTVITAPYDGYTGRRVIQEGQFVQPGQTLLSFVRDNSKWVVANYKETQISHLHVGQKMSLVIDGVPGKRFIGIITAISQATGARYSAIPIDNSTGNFVKVLQRIPVRIEFTKEDNKAEDLQYLRAGMNVESRRYDD